MNQFKKLKNAIQTTDTSRLVKETDCDTKISEMENKINSHYNFEYINTQEFDKSTSDNFEKLKQANLAAKNYFADFADFVKKTDFDDKLKKLIQINQSMHLIKIN